MVRLGTCGCLQESVFFGSNGGGLDGELDIFPTNSDVFTQNPQEGAIVDLYIMYIVWVFPKIMVYPQIIHFNRENSIINHPFWGTPIFGNPPHILFSKMIMEQTAPNAIDFA